MRRLSVVVVLASSLCSQGSWAPVASTTIADASECALAFDSARNVSVLVAPPQYGSPLQVYERSGGDWSLRVQYTTGVGACNFGAAFDTSRNVALLLGGGNWSSNSGSAQTFEWNGASLFSKAALGNMLRRRPSLAYDSIRNQGLVFGGGSGYVPLSDTWIWNGSAWAQVQPAVSPQGRLGHASAFDQVRGRVVLFGGTTSLLWPDNNQPPITYFADTWEWDGTNWYQRAPQFAPSARHGHAMAYDALHGVTYLFGGADAAGNPLNDLWSWDGTNWKQLLTDAPPARRWMATVSFDTARNRLVLFGGINVTFQTYRNNTTVWNFLRDTWEYTPGIPGTFSTFGTGCAGSRGIPTLTNWNGKLPVSGQSFRTQLGNLPLVGATYAFVGASKTNYGSLTLPYDLTLIGMSGCWLNVGADVLFPVTNVLGTGLLDLDIPLGLAGQFLYEQAVVFDPPANILGITTSKGAELKIGG